MASLCHINKITLLHFYGQPFLIFLRNSFISCVRSTDVFLLTYVPTVQVKNLLTVDPVDAVPLRKMMIRKVPRYDESAYALFLSLESAYALPGFSFKEP